MARMAMVVTTAITAVSMMTMNHEARASAWGEGLVIPMVLMKAFAINPRSFMFSFAVCVMIAGWMGANC